MPRLLLHACCAPCSVAVIDELRQSSDLTVIFYNPNIFPLAEYEKRKAEVVRVCAGWGVPMVDLDYRPVEWESVCGGGADVKERGPRCERCIRLRLDRAAAYAKENGFELFATSLSSGRQKSSAMVNAIGRAAGESRGITFLDTDWKKGGRTERANALIRAMNIYRQDYCGCRFSLEQTFDKVREDIYEELFRGFSAFCLYDAIKSSIAPNVVGQESAVVSVGIMNRNPMFFGTTLDCSLTVSHLQVAKCTDKDNRTSSLFKLVRLARRMGKIDDKDEADLNKNLGDDIFKTCRCNRNQRVAHLDTDGDWRRLSVGQMEEAYRLCYKIYEKASGKITMLSHLKRDTGLHLGRILDNYAKGQGHIQPEALRGCQTPDYKVTLEEHKSKTCADEMNRL